MKTELNASDYASMAKEKLREAYTLLLKASEIDGDYEYKDTIKMSMLSRASQVIDITSGL